MLPAPNRPLEVVELPGSEPGPGAVVARVELAGVCGTDMHLQDGRMAIRPHWSSATRPSGG